MNGMHTKNYTLNDQLNSTTANLLNNSMDFLVQNGILSANGGNVSNVSNVKISDYAAVAAMLSENSPTVLNGLSDGSLNLNLFNPQSLTAFHNHLRNYTNLFTGNSNSNESSEQNNNGPMSNSTSNLFDITPAIMLQNSLTGGGTTNGFNDTINSLLKPINASMLGR